MLNQVQHDEVVVQHDTQLAWKILKQVQDDLLRASVQDDRECKICMTGDVSLG